MSRQPAKKDPGSYSLQNRLLLSISLLLFLFLGFTGVVLDRAFQASVEAGAVDRLQVRIYLILAAVDEQNGEFYLLEDLQEARFGQLDSGLYGFISQQGVGELWRSESARTFSLTDPDLLLAPVSIGESLFQITSDTQGEAYFALSYGILWQDGISEYTFSVVESATPYYAEIGNFRRDLWSWLGGVAILLLLIQVFLLRWGLSPLKRMARDLKLIEAGEKEELNKDYPLELRGVTRNLNMLIETERRQQERYRTTLGDLAHSLKTPLAVIGGILRHTGSPGDKHESLTADQAREIDGQLQRMDQIITYQLQRAVQSQQRSALARRVVVEEAVAKILKALAKVYRDKGVDYEIDIASDVFFKGDERDLMEMLGNVLDNSFKYGKSRVRVSASQVMDTGEQENSAGLRLVVEDDGPGIPPEHIEFVLQRGARADTLVRGQGIGLAVVSDIVASYSGEIEVGVSKLGGARIEMLFP